MAEWARLIADAADHLEPPIRAETFVKKFATASQPVVLACDDGADYVVKGAQAGRMIVIDQIVARVGDAVGAPVGEPALVDVPATLIAAEPEMAHMAAGIAHGSRWIPNCTDQTGFAHTLVAENRDRFARIAWLYGWVVASDHQFIYSNDAPQIVYTVDHGHFFRGVDGRDNCHVASGAAA
jgi:hypothetical protein